MESVPSNVGSSRGAETAVLNGALRIDTEQVRNHVDEVVRSTVQETLNQLLDEEADRVAGAGKYERSAERLDTRAGSYRRKLQTKAGEVELTVPRLRKLPLETAIIERYKRREGSVRQDAMKAVPAGMVPVGQRRSGDMIILAIDLGKFTSMACVYDTVKSEHRFEKAATRPTVISELVSSSGADRVVIEVGAQAGWVCDVCEALNVPVQVANPNHEGWRWKTVKRKTDRDDALKLAKLSAMDQIPCVVLPKTRVRQMRSLIAYRQTLVSRRTAIKNSIRSTIDRQGLQMPSGRSGWGQDSVRSLQELAKPIETAGPEELWRAQLHVELRALEQVEELHDEVQRKLDELARDDERVARLRTIPGVGPRLAETVVAMIDDPKRFKSGKQVGAYAGLVPSQFESGMSKRQGRITGRGSTLLRALLVEVAWLMRRYNPHFRGMFDQVCRGIPSRRKIAVVAVARRLLVTCWAMMRDGTDWKAPTAPRAGASIA